jgi:hypothetical protein
MKKVHPWEGTWEGLVSYEEDVDLARRLQSIAAHPEPQAPDSLYRFADSITDGAATSDEIDSHVAPLAFMPFTPKPQSATRPAPLAVLNVDPKDANQDGGT